MDLAKRPRLSLANDAWRIINRKGPAPLFGLCAFQTVLFSSRDLSDSTIFVRFGTASARFPAADVLVASGENLWRMTFHVATQLIPDGTHELACWVEWPDQAEATTTRHSFAIANDGALAATVARALWDAGTPAIMGAVIDSRLFPNASAATTAWFNDSGTLPEAALSFEPASNSEAARRHLARWGFCILDATLPFALIDAFNAEVDAAIADGRLQHRAGTGDRIHGAHLLPRGREVWLFPPVLAFLRAWFRDEPCACQTLLYMCGSEQGAHQDTIHLTPYPAGYMCGVWIALQDIAEGSGELFVYPGSQRSPRVMSADLGLAKVSTDYSSYAAFDRKIAELMREGGYERHAYRPKKGQILVWHENLVHGGGRRSNPELPRRSIVSHYFAKGALAYYDSRGEAAALETVT